MNIEGLGERIVEDFYNFKYLKDIPSIYKLANYQDELMELEGFGQRSISNLLDSIENSKANSLEKLLFALGIRHVGEKVAKIIAKKYRNIDVIIKAPYEEMVDIPDIGDIIALSIRKYFDDEENILMIEKLKSYGINTLYLGKDTIKNNIFTDKKFVITGTISFANRDKIKEYIESNGGFVIESVSNKTDVVIVGENAGSKLDKAKELNITIWNEKTLKDNMEA